VNGTLRVSVFSGRTGRRVSSAKLDYKGSEVTFGSVEIVVSAGTRQNRYDDIQILLQQFIFANTGSKPTIRFSITAAAPILGLRNNAINIMTS
jgi:hypothetical protein